MINHVSFQGRFTKDPELKHTSNNLSYVKSTLAWSEKYGDNENTCFLNCVAYRNIAEFIFKYFKKGDMVLVEGRLLTKYHRKAPEFIPGECQRVLCIAKKKVKK